MGTVRPFGLFLALTLTPAASLFAAPAEPAAKPPAALDAAALPDARRPVFKIRPSSLQFSSYVNFDEEGKPNNIQQNGYLQVHVVCPTGVAPTVYRDAQLLEMVTDTGARIGGTSDKQNGTLGEFSERAAEFGIGFRLPLLPSGTRQLKVVTGKFTIRYGVGELRQVELGTLQQIDGKKVRIDGLERPLTVTVRRQDRNNRVQVEAPTEDGPLIAEVRFYTPESREVQSRSQGWGSNNDTVYRMVSVKATNDVRVVLGVYPKLEDLVVPFALQDLPVPGANDEGAEIKVEAVPGMPRRPKPVANPQVPPAPAAEELRVKLE